MDWLYPRSIKVDFVTGTQARMLSSAPCCEIAGHPVLIWALLCSIFFAARCCCTGSAQETCHRRLIVARRAANRQGPTLGAFGMFGAGYVPKVCFLKPSACGTGREADGRLRLFVPYVPYSVYEVAVPKLALQLSSSTDCLSRRTWLLYYNLQTRLWPKTK